MPRDYAKSRKPAPRGAATQRNRGGTSGLRVPGWVWGVLGLSVGLLYAAWSRIDHRSDVPLIPAPVAPAGVTGSAKPLAPRDMSHAAAQSAAQPPDKLEPEAVAVKPAAPSPRTAPKYSFYELLPSYEVVIPRDDAAASARAGKATTAEIAAPGQYLIQVGAYKTREEADRGRANLALIGVESKVEQVTIDQSQTWFRVRIGPESSLPKAQETLQRLDENGIKGMLVKVHAG